jgi:hypothetical protein
MRLRWCDFDVKLMKSLMYNWTWNRHKNLQVDVKLLMRKVITKSLKLTLTHKSTKQNLWKPTNKFCLFGTGLPQNWCAIWQKLGFRCVFYNSYYFSKTIGFSCSVYFFLSFIFIIMLSINQVIYFFIKITVSKNMTIFLIL